jgi:DMSO/TMAO reductase YedYZ heme-binding membrane subunit
MAFYILALALSFMFAITSYVTYPFWLQNVLFLLMQKGTLSTSLFVVVMYMGVFKDFNLIKSRLMPTRATLSIIACVLILGHVVKYLIAYLPRFGVLAGVIQSGLILAIACFMLMLVLGITSFQAIKRKMPATKWISLQKTAYVFYALVYVHIVVLLLPSIFGNGGSNSLVSVVIYTVVFGAYAILRIIKYKSDKTKLIY